MDLLTYLNTASKQEDASINAKKSKHQTLDY